MEKSVSTGKFQRSSNPDSSANSSSSNKLLGFVGAVVVLSLVFTIGFFAGKIWGGVQSIDPDSPIYKIIGQRTDATVTDLDFNLFWEVWRTLDDRYVETDVSDEDLYYGAIKGMVSGVGDPVTVFLTPEETEEYNKGNQGKFEGVGIELGYDDGNLVVVAPLEGSPAIQAGVRAGDRIIKVDDEDIIGESIFKVVSLIRGEKGTDVVLTVIHKGGSDSEEITITRDEITVPSVTFDGMEGDIAVIDVDRFTEASLTAWQNRWDEVVSEALAKNPDALIIDLRGNPGGFFNAAIWAAGEFLDNGTLVSKQRDRDGKEVVFNVGRDGRLLDIPIVVLVDEGSASASEILAGALQHYGRAYVIGENTYGKGTAQEIVSFSDRSSLHITIMKWLLPNGETLDKDNVIEPDKVVEYSDDDFTNGDDPQLDEAIEYLNSNM